MVIVTGATGAIGQEICKCFAAEGEDICVCCFAREQEAEALTAQLAARYGVRAVWRRMDLADAASVEAAIGYFLSVFGHCDYLINNAAVAPICPVSEMDASAWRRVIDVNLSGSFYTCRAVLGGMYHRGGSIVNVSSMWGQLGASCEVAYSASKAGVEGMSRALAEEYAGRVRVNALALGFVDTPMNAHMSEEDKRAFFAENPDMRCLTAAEAAEAIWRLAHDDVTGEVRRLGW